MEVEYLTTEKRAQCHIIKNTGDLTKPLGYVIPETFAVKINANKWYGDDNLSNEGEAPASSYANGIMIGQMTFTKDKK